jgi:hypothetical protein
MREVVAAEQNLALVIIVLASSVAFILLLIGFVLFMLGLRGTTGMKTKIFGAALAVRSPYPGLVVLALAVVIMIALVLRPVTKVTYEGTQLRPEDDRVARMVLAGRLARPCDVVGDGKVKFTLGFDGAGDNKAVKALIALLNDLAANAPNALNRLADPDLRHRLSAERSTLQAARDAAVVAYARSAYGDANVMIWCAMLRDERSPNSLNTGEREVVREIERLRAGQ